MKFFQAENYRFWRTRSTYLSLALGTSVLIFLRLLQTPISLLLGQEISFNWLNLIFNLSTILLPLSVIYVQFMGWKNKEERQTLISLGIKKTVFPCAEWLTLAWRCLFYWLYFNILVLLLALPRIQSPSNLTVHYLLAEISLFLLCLLYLAVGQFLLFICRWLGIAMFCELVLYYLVLPYLAKAVDAFSFLSFYIPYVLYPNTVDEFTASFSEHFLWWILGLIFAGSLFLASATHLLQRQELRA